MSNIVFAKLYSPRPPQVWAIPHAVLEQYHLLWLCETCQREKVTWFHAEPCLIHVSPNWLSDLPCINEIQGALQLIGIEVGNIKCTSSHASRQGSGIFPLLLCEWPTVPQGKIYPGNSFAASRNSAWKWTVQTKLFALRSIHKPDDESPWYLAKINLKNCQVALGDEDSEE